MTTLLDIGQKLRVERERQSLFKTKLAELSGIHRNTLSELEAGTGNVELNTLIAICDKLGLDIQLVPKEVSASNAPEGGRKRSALSQMLHERLSATTKDTE
jgi:transcriptional regulator with XRE-family HTH domain